MTTLLQGLRTCRAELTNRLASIDEQILSELDGMITGNDSRSRKPVSATTERPAEVNRVSGDIDPVKKRKTSGAGIKKSSKKSSKKRRNKSQTWGDKILSVLSKAEGRGMSSSEIMKAVKVAEESEGRSANPATINTTLQALETKAKRIRVERSATGRKMHFALGNPEVVAS